MDASTDRVGIGTATPSSKLEVNGDGSVLGALNVTGISKAAQFQLLALNTAPSSATDTGTTGEIRIDANYIYICTATNTWVRADLATW